MRANRSSGPNPGARNDLPAALRRWIDAGRFHGTVVRIERSGEARLVGGLGRQDPGRYIPMQRTPDRLDDVRELLRHGVYAAAG